MTPSTRKTSSRAQPSKPSDNTLLFVLFSVAGLLGLVLYILGIALILINWTSESRDATIRAIEDNRCLLITEEDKTGINSSGVLESLREEVEKW